jgi:tritrans,polycis-undecaprenyl-diphosphate synthase [geranylgeranyl-diphosphate specific]
MDKNIQTVEDLKMAERQITRVPKHVGIIMDGNRRLAKKLMLKPWMGHEWGAKKVEEVLDWCRESGIKELTLYAFSVQNFNRPKEEFDYLMKIFKENFARLKNDPKLSEYGIRINVIGRLWMFPKDVEQEMQEVMKLTKGYSNYTINFAMAYGGQEEVVDAAKKIAEQVKSGSLNIDEINEETFARNLYMPDQPDLIIRTGGEMRTSNFLAFQSVYSEWFFIEKMWPEFEKSDWTDIMDEYGKRERRFGKGSFEEYNQPAYKPV